MITVRLFLDKDTGATYEVSANIHRCTCDFDGAAYLGCSCPLFKDEGMCAHVLRVAMDSFIDIDETGDEERFVIPLVVDTGHDFPDTADPAAVREFLLKHGHVEVI